MVLSQLFLSNKKWKWSKKMKKIRNSFYEIKTSIELFEFMVQNIEYGYLGKNGKVYHFDDEDFFASWEEEYILESASDMLVTSVGNCWDQVELQRYWFEANGYEVKTIYEMVALDYSNEYPTHAFLIFKDKEDNCFHWFETSDSINCGIHKFSTLEELFAYQYARYVDRLKTFSVSKQELDAIIIREFKKPTSHISAREYINFVVHSKEIILDLM